MTTPATLESGSPVPQAAAAPGSPIIAGLRYRDAHAAIGWLTRVLGFRVQALYEGPEGTVAHAQLIFSNNLGTGMVMLGSASNGGEFAAFLVHPEDTGRRSTQMVTLVVEDAAEFYERALRAGTEIVQPLAEMPYGGKAFGCRDLEGYLWSIGEYNPWTDVKGEA